MSHQANLLQLLRRIPPKWALTIVGLFLLYWLGQPILNRTFGWHLPTIAQMLGEAEATPTRPAADEDEYLKDIGGGRFQSPAGLIYARGSAEGHRLKHIARHLEDQPTRPGYHGVFNGNTSQVLQWIDEGYSMAKQGDRNARTREEDDATIYEITFEKPIGFLGGSEGKERGNPPSKRLRIVVNDLNVITAFPF